MVPWQDPDFSAAWVWTLRHRVTNENRELAVRVSWKGHASIEQVPSQLARDAFHSQGWPGVRWFIDNDWPGWAEIIIHSQSTKPHGSTGSYPIVRLDPPGAVHQVIYVELLDEGVDVWRPVDAVQLEDGWYRITGVKADPDERWAFDTGDVVRCELRLLSRGHALVPVEKRMA
jgi:hypothetical protein